MEAINIEQKRKFGFFSPNNSVTVEKNRYDDLDEFLKGTISGNELVKYVCDRLDEKYSQDQSCGI